jgi:hypothetical protein
VFRRDDRPRQRLPEDLEDLARGDADRVRRPPRRPRIQDERPIALVRGVANRDARVVFDARLARLEAERAGYSSDEAGARDRLAEGLREALELRVWRGRSLTSFDALAEQMLSLPANEARELAGEARELTEEAVAIWIRAEAALLKARIEGRVQIVVDGKHERLAVELDVTTAPDAMQEIAHHLGQLRADLRRW